MRDVEGRRWDFDNEVVVQFKILERHYFGYLDEHEKVLFFHDTIAGDPMIVFPAEILMMEYRSFPAYDGVSALPVDPVLHIEALTMPSEEGITGLQMVLERLDEDPDNDVP